MAKQKSIIVEKQDEYDLFQARNKLVKQQPKTNKSTKTTTDHTPTIINATYNNTTYNITSKDIKQEESTGEGGVNLELSSMQMGYIKNEVNKDLEGKFNKLDSDLKNKINRDPFFWAIGISIAIILAISSIIITYNCRLSDKIEVIDNKYDTLNAKYPTNE